MKLAEIASALGATLENGDPATEITGVAGIEEAAAGQITFVANPKYAAAAKTTAASAVIVSEDFPAIATGMLRSKNPYLGLRPRDRTVLPAAAIRAGIHPTAVIAPTAKMGANAHIGAYVVIDEDVEIGDNAVLLPHVVIYRGARIGNNFFAHAHAVVREYCTLGDNVVLQNGVVGRLRRLRLRPRRRPLGEDRAVRPDNAGERRRGAGQLLHRPRQRWRDAHRRGVKIDNLAQVGHGSAVGEHTLLCAQVGLAGSTVVGKNVIIAGQAGVAGHCKIGDGVIITAQSGTHGDIPAGAMVSGSPAFDHKQWLRAVGIFNKLPELAKAVRSLMASQPERAGSRKGRTVAAACCAYLSRTSLLGNRSTSGVTRANPSCF